MAKAKPILRILLGLIFFVFGLAFFFIKQPPPQTPEIGAFMSGLGATGYFYYLLKFTEITCGALLLANLYVPLAMIILSPIIVNIFLFHAFMEHSGLPMAVIIALLHCTLAYMYRDSFKPILKVKN